MFYPLPSKLVQKVTILISVRGLSVTNPADTAIRYEFTWFSQSLKGNFGFDVIGLESELVTESLNTAKICT